MKTTFLLLLLPTLLFAQEFTFRQEFDTIPVEIDGWQTYAPWMGGENESAPGFADIDGDADMDLFVGNHGGFIDYIKNIGTPTSPLLKAESLTWESIACFPNNSSSNPSFWDLDGDADLDILVGAGYVRYYRNEGSISIPNFTGFEDTLFDVSGNWVFGTHVALIDIDSDNDGDLICGEYQGHLQFYRNIGSCDSFAFDLEDDYWLDLDVGGYADPAFCDIDSDGDHDLFIGDQAGRIWFYRNDGDSVNYDFGYVTSSYNGIDVGENASPEFADIDGDGDFDLFVGRDQPVGTYLGMGDIYFYENIGTPEAALWQLITKNYLSLDEGEDARIISINIDADTDIDLFYGHEGNALTQFENVGDEENASFLWITSNYQDITVNGCNPHFRDIDNDQDPDLFIGEGIIPNPPYPGLFLFRNNGTPQNASFSLVSDDLIPYNYHAAIRPSLTDIDADDDNDIFLCDNNGTLYFSENIGTPVLPSFIDPVENWQGIQFYAGRFFNFYDLDSDGDLDLNVATGAYGDTYVLQYENIGSPQVPLMNQTPDTILRLQSGGIGFGSLDILDIDDDGDGDFLLEAKFNGGILFFRNTTGDTSAVQPRLSLDPLHGIQFSLGPNP
ncbi:VCBS repeat-containing protein, partial [bacterium]|nr:VCBS repeat-containing protein [bacterium]